MDLEEWTETATRIKIYQGVDTLIPKIPQITAMSILSSNGIVSRSAEQY